jgi:recombinational DNA repair protein (RecF pathway)
MNAISDGWKVVRCAGCREPVNHYARTEERGATYCARCASMSPERAARISRIRAAALAARARNARARPSSQG